MISSVQDTRIHLANNKANGSGARKRRVQGGVKAHTATEADTIMSKLEALRGRLSGSRQSSSKLPNEKLYLSLAKAYQYASKLAEGGAQWKAFCRHPYWKSSSSRPVPNGSHDALRHILGFIFKTAGNPALQKKVSKYRTALAPSFEDGMSPRKLLELLQKNGLRGLGERTVTGGCEFVCRINETDFKQLEAGMVVRLKIKRVGRTSAQASILP